MTNNFINKIHKGWIYMTSYRRKGWERKNKSDMSECSYLSRNGKMSDDSILKYFFGVSLFIFTGTISLSMGYAIIKNYSRLSYIIFSKNSIKIGFK